MESPASVPVPTESSVGSSPSPLPLPSSLGEGPGLEVAQRATVRPGASSKFDRPDSEVRPTRRRFDVATKLRVLREADRCIERGSIGALLRREGIYSSLLVRWRKERDTVAKNHLVKKRGPKPVAVNPLAEENRQLKKELARAVAGLERAKYIIDLQKKVAKLLGEPYVPGELEEDD
jgi:transposase